MNSRHFKMKELSLFSGAGGGLLGTKLLGFKNIGYVENNDYCQRVIKQRIKDGILDEAPIFGDIRAFNREGYALAYSGMVDLLTAGFPCQPFSVAGKQKGETDERNMWPETIECIRLVRPRYALLENVPGLLANEYMRTILGEITESGYDCKWRILSAAEVGAPHRRDRLWIFCTDTNSTRELQQERNEQKQRRCPGDLCKTDSICDSTSAGSPHRVGFQMGTGSKWDQELQSKRSNWWAVEPDVGRVAHGVAHRVDRLKAIGNGQIPGVVQAVFYLLLNEIP